jgi:hypothetical protein
MQIYSKLLSEGVPMKQIDEMDFIGYMRVLMYASRPKLFNVDDIL